MSGEQGLWGLVALNAMLSLGFSCSQKQSEDFLEETTGNGISVSAASPW